jgi:hypothetical protein
MRARRRPRCVFRKSEMIDAGCDLHARDSTGYTLSALASVIFPASAHCNSILETWIEVLRRCDLEVNGVLATDQKDLAMTTAVDFEPRLLATSVAGMKEWKRSGQSL